MNFFNNLHLNNLAKKLSVKLAKNGRKNFWSMKVGVYHYILKHFFIRAENLWWTYPANKVSGRSRDGPDQDRLEHVGRLHGAHDHRRTEQRRNFNVSTASSFVARHILRLGRLHRQAPRGQRQWLFGTRTIKPFLSNQKSTSITHGLWLDLRHLGRTWV